MYRTLRSLYASGGQVESWVVACWAPKPMGEVEVTDCGEVHLNGVGLECMAEVGCKQVDGVLGSWKGGDAECIAEGVVLPDSSSVGG